VLKSIFLLTFSLLAFVRTHSSWTYLDHFHDQPFQTTTAPYMHDGSISTLEEVIEHYAAGGRTIASGPYAGVGRNNPNKAGNVQGFNLTTSEKKDLVAFLESLTDKDFLTDPRLSDPWK
jgi:cytochrome c peroxidase